MPRCWSAEFFLKFLNAYVCVEDNTIRLRSDEERDQESLPRNTVKEFVYTQEVDVVIVGFCSWEESESHVAWLRNALASMKLRHILMFAQCCGSYPQEFQETIRAAFPEYVWLFPDMFDLYDNLGGDRANLTAAQCLMKAGVIGLKDGS